ncbi:hypothetical protein DPMN_092505 [Dreissena polymorpha]|uniref:Uncharacterized protein n=1 Tax=Dreissena polymorpha TaxID=45954 RepID=A0A9D4L2J4_DREPO|nr:hypothetical protein DPMN_092505 [Dreissena polymorpha]
MFGLKTTSRKLKTQHIICPSSLRVKRLIAVTALDIIKAASCEKTNNRVLRKGRNKGSRPPLDQNVTSRVFTCFYYIHIEKTALLPGGNVFHRFLTKFYEDWTNIVTSRVFIRKTAPHPGGHTKILTKLHEDWASNVTSTVFKRFLNSNQTTNVATRVFTRQNVDEGRRTTDKRLKHILDIVYTNILTKFYQDRVVSMASTPAQHSSATFENSIRFKSVTANAEPAQHSRATFQISIRF